MKWAKTLLWMIVFIIAFLFSIQNGEQVTLQFVLLPIRSYQWIEVPRVSLPLSLVLLAAIFLGALIGGIGDFYRRFQLKQLLRQSQKTVEQLEQEVESLRNSAFQVKPFHDGKRER